jgi:ParB/RepB/Spo0J family partition protein
MELKEMAVSRSNLLTFKVNDIVIPKDNCLRLDYDQEKIENLALDIMMNGQKTPVIIRRDGELAVLVSGSRRMKSIKWANKFKNAKIELVDCVIEKRVKNEEGKLVIPKEDDRIFSQISENHREDLSQLEYGTAFKILIEKHGYNAPGIAKRVGRSDRWVRDCLELVDLDKPIKDKVEKGEIKPATARKIQKASKEDRETALLESDMGKKVTSKHVDDLKKEREEKKTFNVDEYIKGHEREGWVLLREAGQEVDWSHKITIEQKDPLLLAVMLKKRSG